MAGLKFTLIKSLKTNNRFNYTPRYYKGKENVDQKGHATRFDAYTDTFNKNDYGSHWREERNARRNWGNGGLNKVSLLIAAILILIFLFIIDFDLSIFY